MIRNAAAPGWTADELDRIAAAVEMQISPERADGTLPPPVTVWVVRHGDGLYVRSYRGDSGAWYRAARAGRHGRISAGGIVKSVTFAAVTDPAINRGIDAAFTQKYHQFGIGYVERMVAPEVRATTLTLVPAPSGS
jgi:hypothetical protein